MSQSVPAHGQPTPTTTTDFEGFLPSLTVLRSPPFISWNRMEILTDTFLNGSQSRSIESIHKKRKMEI